MRGRKKKLNKNEFDLIKSNFNSLLENDSEIQRANMHFEDISLVYSEYSNISNIALFFSIIHFESRFVSQANVQNDGKGLMQIINSTCQGLGYDISMCQNDVKTNIRAGMKLYQNNFDIIKKKLNSVNINDDIANDFFTIFAYGRGSFYSSYAIDKYVEYKDIRRAVNDACKYFYDTESKKNETIRTRGINTYCPNNTFEDPFNKVGGMFVLLGRNNTLSESRVYVENYLNNLVK